MKKAPGKMKVICICKDSSISSGPKRPIGLLVEGDIYTVTHTVEMNGMAYYELEEIDSIGSYYNSRLFIPLSTLDETTFSRNYQKEPQL